MGASFLDALITLMIEFGLPWTPKTPYFLVGIFALVMLPFFLRNIRIGQARNLLKRSNTVFHLERQKMENAAISKVADIPTALMGLADQAISMKRFELAEKILALVPMERKYRHELHKLQLKINPPPPPIEKEIFAIEQLLENSLIEVAENRYQKLCDRWPNHPELQRLAPRFLNKPKNSLE